MGCSPRFRQRENVAAPNFVTNRVEAKHLLRVVWILGYFDKNRFFSLDRFLRNLTKTFLLQEDE